MQINDILNRLYKVSQRGEQYTALCPAHDDKNPSLAVTVKDDKILVYCQAGCTTQDIVGSMGLQLKDLFTESNLSAFQRLQYRHKKTRRELRESLFFEAHNLLQYLNDRSGDIVKTSDSNYLKLHPEFQPMPEEPWEGELEAAKQTKKIIGELYGV